MVRLHKFIEWLVQHLDNHQILSAFNLLLLVKYVFNQSNNEQ